MSIKLKIQKQIVEALKKTDRRRVEALRFLVSVLEKKELSLPVGKMSQKEEIEVLAKELKNKKEAREMFAKAGRDDLVEQIDYEIGLVKEYLPKMLSLEEVSRIVDEVMAGMEKPNLGVVIGQVMAKSGGRAEGAVVAKLVKEKLGEK